MAPLKVPTVSPTSPVTTAAPAKASFAGGAAIRQVRRAGTVSLPAAFDPLTSKVCVPIPSPVYDTGELQAAKAEPSRLHWNVAGLPEAKENEASRVDTTPAGPAEILVYGDSLEAVGGLRS